MSWVSPIFNRVLADVTNKTAVGYFNFGDFNRIQDNSDALRTAMDGYGYPVAALVVPSISPADASSIPTNEDINDLLANIQNLRDVCYLPASLIPAEFKTVYTGGSRETPPDFEDVNDWEESLSVMYVNIPMVVDYHIPCGVAACGQSRMWQNQFR